MVYSVCDEGSSLSIKDFLKDSMKNKWFLVFTTDDNLVIEKALEAKLISTIAF